MRASWWAGESGRSGGSWCLWTSRRRWRREAGRWGAELIVSHHPVIFHPVKALTDQTSTGRTLLLLAEQGIGAVCAHTNLDAAQGGVNDCLARALELDGVELLCRDGTDGQGRPYGIGRVGTAPQAGCSAAEFATFIKEKLSACSIRFVETGRPVRRVAVGGRRLRLHALRRPGGGV